LLVVAFLPFPPGSSGRQCESTIGERAAVRFYGATLLVISVVMTWMCHYAAASRELLLADDV
jgi:hypothetical protein